MRALGCAIEAPVTRADDDALISGVLLPDVESSSRPMPDETPASDKRVMSALKSVTLLA